MDGASAPTVSAHAGFDLPVPLVDVWPVFLPVVSMQDSRPMYSEALARTDRDCGPRGLIALAEERGFVGDVDCSMLAQTIVLLRESAADVCVGVNVSAGTLKRGVERWVRQLSTATDVSSRIMIELTETQVFDDRRALSEFVAAGRQCGARFALDDYESGSFDDELVRIVAPDIIKLSNVWEGGVIGSKPRLEQYLAKVSKLGVSDVVVEWVDSKWKFDLISSLPITHAQGLFVGRFLSAGELAGVSGSTRAPFSVAR